MLIAITRRQDYTIFLTLIELLNMKIEIKIDLDTENPKDLAVFYSLIDSIRLINDSNTPTLSYEEAWQQCSWEIITFALTVLKIHDGISDKGTFAFFSSLLNPTLTELCGDLTERAISSRVGRAAVICKKMGEFRLMEVAVRRKDQVKRVYVTPEAKEALLKLLQGDWGDEFNNYLKDNELKALDFSEL